MKIVMVRHGMSESNIKRILSGSNETPLSAEGRDELISLRDKLNYPETDIYISSPLSRCLDTFKAIYPEKSLKRTEDDFIEIYFGDYTGKSFDDVNLDEYFCEWFLDKNIANGELYSDFNNRVFRGLTNVAKELQENKLDSATIVAHSTVIKVIVKHIKNIPSVEYRNIPMKNGLDDKLTHCLNT